MNEEPTEQNVPPPEPDIPPPPQDISPPAQDVPPPEEKQTTPGRERRIYVTSSIVSAVTAGLIVGLVFGGLAVNDTLRGDSEPAVQVVAQPTQAAATPTPLPAVVENVSIDDDPIMGPVDAPVTIVEFSDFQCPYCEQAASSVLPQIFQQYPDEVRLVYRDFPLTQIHPQALPAALAAECADDQGKFWEYHDLLFANQSALDDASLEAYAAQIGLDQAVFDQCYTSQEHLDEIRHDYEDGLTYGVSGTPAFFVNGIRIVGAQPLAVFQQAIEQALAES
jgi:protein-disulfide isomerase